MFDAPPADRVLFDPDAVAPQSPELVNDLPLDGRLLIARATGIMATCVAGTQLSDNGTHTGALPGPVLRSYEA